MMDCGKTCSLLCTALILATTIASLFCGFFVNCELATHRPNEQLLASQHFNYVLKNAKCQKPLARVININNELRPSAIKKYIPHCTILHHCGPHSGCCRQENEECVPKTVEEVKLYFWTIELTPRGHKKGIEMITMHNHTECQCAPIKSSVEVTEPTILNPTETTTTKPTLLSPPLVVLNRHNHYQARNHSND